MPFLECDLSEVFVGSVTLVINSTDFWKLERNGDKLACRFWIAQESEPYIFAHNYLVRFRFIEHLLLLSVLSSDSCLLIPIQQGYIAIDKDLSVRSIYWYCSICLATSYGCIWTKILFDLE